MAATAPKPNQPKVLFLIIAVIVMVAFLASIISNDKESIEKVDYSRFKEIVKNPPNENDRIVKAKFNKNTLTGTRADNGQIETIVPLKDESLRTFLEKNGVKLSFEKPESENMLKALLINIIPMILLLVVIFIIMRSIQAGGGKAMSFGKSKAKLINDLKPKITFKDIAGIDEAKYELKEIIEFLKEPKKFTKLGGRIPKGVLLIGSPGTGKTILAKGVSGEAGVPFFSISGSDFVEMFVGVGASRVRDMFDQAKKNSPCIVFIDEIDAVGRHRGAGLGGGHDEREQTLNQLLVEMDGFEANEGVIIIAATNRPDVLDPALLRPGRFDRRVNVPNPDIKGRKGILEVHSRRAPLDKDVDLAIIAQSTPGFTGADLENLINEAALIAARENHETVNMQHCEKAKDKVIMGAERQSMIMSESEKKTTAYHEAGHALVGLLTEGCDPIHKVTIIPRGRALGVTIMLPSEDRLTMSKEYAESFIVYAMGGRAAEELIFNARTSGAHDDINKATEIAKKMVCSWGMSEKIGPLSVGKKDDEEVFIGRSMSSSQDLSNKLAEEIDSEIRKFVTDGYNKALTLQRDNKEKLISIAEALLIKETLDSKDLKRIMGGEDIITKDEIETYNKRCEQAKNWHLEQEEEFKEIATEENLEKNSNSGSSNKAEEQEPKTETS